VPIYYLVKLFLKSRVVEIPTLESRN